MIKENGKNGLVYIPKDCIVELEQCKKIKQLPTEENNWYAVDYDCSIELNLLEVMPDYYKISVRLHYRKNFLQLKES